VWTIDPDVKDDNPLTPMDDRTAFSFDPTAQQKSALPIASPTKYLVAIRNAYRVNIQSSTNLGPAVFVPGGFNFQFVANVEPKHLFEFRWEFADNSQYNTPTGPTSTVAKELPPGINKFIIKLYRSGSLVAVTFLEVDLRAQQALAPSDIGTWRAANSGGYGVTNDTWDISMLPDGVTFDIRFDAQTVPDKFLIEYVSQTYLDTGWRGASSYQGKPSYPGGIKGPGRGQVDNIFLKTPGNNTFQATVIGGEPGTAWGYDIRARIP
jgi:hypothetical protein